MVGIPRKNLWRSVSHRLSDWSAACILLTVGGLLIWDTGLIDRGAYGGMQTVAYQATWASAFTLIGLFRLIALLFDAVDPPRPLLRAAGAFAGGFLWLQISLTYIGTVDNWGLLLAITPWLFLTDFVAMIRAASEVSPTGEADG